MQPVALILALVSAAAAPRPWAIQGVITSEQTNAPVEGALVLVQCTCLEQARETTTDARGRYRFGTLGPGTYTIEVRKGAADISKIVTLPP